MRKVKFSTTIKQLRNEGVDVKFEGKLINVTSNLGDDDTKLVLYGIDKNPSKKGRIYINPDMKGFVNVDYLIIKETNGDVTFEPKQFTNRIYCIISFYCRTKEHYNNHYQYYYTVNYDDDDVLEFELTFE